MKLVTFNDSPANAPSFNTYDASALTSNRTNGSFHLTGSRAFIQRPTNHRHTKIKLEIQSKPQRTFTTSMAAEAKALTQMSVSRDPISRIMRCKLTKCASLLSLMNCERLATFHTGKSQTLPVIRNKLSAKRIA
jgi:hypothetical protein